MADDWVELTPAPESLEPGYAKDKIRVNLSNATSIWRRESGSSEIWFFAAGDNARRFYVTETPAEILALRER